MAVPLSSYVTIFEPYIIVVPSSTLNDLITLQLTIGTVEQVWQGSLRVDVGDSILFDAKQAQKFTVGGVNYYIVNENNIYLRETGALP